MDNINASGNNGLLNASLNASQSETCCFLNKSSIKCIDDLIDQIKEKKEN